MKRALAISVIALVVVVMGMSAVAPMIPEAVAGHGEPDPLWPSACDFLRSVPNPPSFIVQMIEDHCSTF